MGTSIIVIKNIMCGCVLYVNITLAVNILHLSKCDCILLSQLFKAQHKPQTFFLSWLTKRKRAKPYLCKNCGASFNSV